MSTRHRGAACDADIAIAVLGHGGVGRALLQLLATPAAAGIHLVGIADSTRQLENPRGLVPGRAAGGLAAGGPRCEARLLAALDASGARRRVIVDATAADAVANRHAAWLAGGYDVVSANKAAIGGSQADWTAVRTAQGHGARYGDAATVGAGLPVLQALRRLRGCGDRLLAIEGVLSGSLSWLFNRFDGSRPFSELVRQAHAAGYSEPDPRLDLDGADVARKLLILARSAGHALEPADVRVEGLVPEALRATCVAEFLARADELDAGLEARRREAAGCGQVIRFVGTLDEEGRARVGLQALPGGHPAARLAGTDNLFVLHTLRYRPRPLVIQGPGAGRELTAQALLGDLLALRLQRAA